MKDECLDCPPLKFEINGQDFWEPGIDPGQDAANNFRVRQRPPSACKGTYAMLVLSADKGLKAVRCKDEKGKWITQSLLFAKDKWDQSQIRKWIKDNGYVIQAERFEKLQTVPVILRRLFNYRLDLIQEWREYFIEGLEKADPRKWAWFRFESKYARSPKGRWHLRE
jgi:hypothetical protein